MQALCRDSLLSDVVLKICANAGTRSMLNEMRNGAR